jgi:hypothetical protein
MKGQEIADTFRALSGKQALGAARQCDKTSLLRGFGAEIFDGPSSF